MAEDTQNAATTDISSGLSQMVSGIWGSVAAAASSTRGLIALALILLTLITLAGKWPAPQQDNEQIVNALVSISGQVAKLKAQVTTSTGEIGSQLDRIEMQRFGELAPAAPVPNPPKPAKVKAKPDPKPSSLFGLP